MENDAIPPQPRLGVPNEAIDVHASTLTVPQKLTPFPPGQLARLVGISSFGLSGTLAHLILEDAPPQATFSGTPRKMDQLFLLSAHTRADFKASAQRYLEYFSHQNLQAKNLEAVCRTSQIGRDHFAVRRAWLVDGWRTLMIALRHASNQPPPTRNASSLPKVGLWLGLPLGDANLGRNDHPLYHAMLSKGRSTGWTAENGYFLKQLAIARCLASFGCDVSVVGGEGLSEYVGAVFAEVLPSTAVFQTSMPIGEDRQACAIRCDKSRLEELLVSRKYEELSLVGEHGSRLFTVQGNVDAILDLSLQDGVEVQSKGNLLLPRTHTLDHTVSLSSPTVQLVSGHLGEIISPSLTTNLTYWAGVQGRQIQSVDAWKALASTCDIVVNISDTRDIEEVLGDQCISFYQSSMYSVLGRLFEKGCVLDWPNITPPGDTAHIPTYRWATDSEWKSIQEENY